MPACFEQNLSKLIEVKNEAISSSNTELLMVLFQLRAKVYLENDFAWQNEQQLKQSEELFQQLLSDIYNEINQ